MLKDKNIIVGVTGGIAAYKSASLISALKKEDANVFVIMTKNAKEFITPLTLSTLSNNKVVEDTFERIVNYDVEHISLAKRADIFIIAPATANILGKVANGIADDILSTTIMATTAPVVFAPAMNNNMYNNKIVQNNIQKLKDYGYLFVEPDLGQLACGDNAVGKLASTTKIIEKVKKVLSEVNLWIL